MLFMSDIDKIVVDVLKKIKPDEKEELHIKEFLRNLGRIAKTISGLDHAFVGSTGKGTWLRNDHDIDLFILFPKDTSREDLESRGLEIGKKIAKQLKSRFQIKYAEHPYVRINVKDLHIDVVPCYRIAKGDEIISAVDRSPLHLEFVLENMTQQMRDEVRLLKQFCKGIGVYGSDVKNMGFSGYICELLVIKYKTFVDVIKSAAKWQAPHTLYFDKEPAAKFSAPLIMIDPTDAKRNASANVSAENFVKFVRMSDEFLQKPDREFFFPEKPKPLSHQEIKILKSRQTDFLVLKIKKPDVIDDIIYPQARRALRRLNGMLRHNKFVVVRSYEFLEKDVIFFFEFAVAKLPAVEKMVGPSIFSKVHSKEFITKYEDEPLAFGPYVENDCWIIEKRRHFEKATDLLKSFAQKPAEELILSGVPDNIAKNMKACRLIEKDFWKFVQSHKGFSVFLKEKYF